MTYLHTQDVLMRYGMDQPLSAERRDELVAAEARHITRCIAGVERDTDREGLALSLALDVEIASELIDRDEDIKHLVRLVCADRAGTQPISDAEIAAKVRTMVLAEVEALAERRVSA